MDAVTLSLMRDGLLASVLVGTVCGYLSVYVVLKRLVFLAVALAQLASAGVAAALFWHVEPTWPALIAVLAGALFFSWNGVGRVLPRENAIGTAYALAATVSVVLIAKHPQGETHLLHLLDGNVLTVAPQELWVMGGLAVVVLALFTLFGKELLFTSFDVETARTLGIRTRLWEVLFYLALGVVIATAIRLGGLMLVFALLVLPGYAALLAGLRLCGAFWWATSVAILAAAAGLYLSFASIDLPTSSITISLLGVCVLLGAGTGLLRRWRGKRTAG